MLRTPQKLLRKHFLYHVYRAHMHSIGCSLCFLKAVPGLAQFQTPVPGKLSDLVNPQPGDPVFILYSDLPSPLADIVGVPDANINRAGRRASMAHRFFYDRGAHIFFGYDIVVQPQDRIDMYSVGFFNLSMELLDFPIDSTDSLNPTLWKQVPLPTLLPSQVVRAGVPDFVDYCLSRSQNWSGTTRHHDHRW